MSEESWGFAPPPFRAEDSMQSLRRQLRELGLTEREGIWERRGLAMVRLRLCGADELEAARVQRPSRNSPVWQSRPVKSAAHARDFITDLKKQLALWSDNDE